MMNREKNFKKILAIDTTGAVASAAVCDETGRIFQQTSGSEENHLQELFPMIQRVLEEAGISKMQLELIAVAVGPGSFTGIRIGMAAAKTLAQALQLPMVPVQTLASFLYAEGSEHSGRLICPMIDARRSQVYAGAWMPVRDGGGFQEVVPSDAYAVEEFLQLASDAARKNGLSGLLFYGTGAEAFSAQIGALAEETLAAEASKTEHGTETADANAAAMRTEPAAPLQTEIAPPQLLLQNAGNVLRAAMHAVDGGAVCSYDEVHPVYLRKSEAERKLAAGQLGKKKSLKKERPQTEAAPKVPSADEPVTFRAAGEADVAAFAALDAQCFSHAWSQQAFRGELDGSKQTIYVAAENSAGELIGFAGIAWVLDEGEVNRVAVHPLYRGRMIADRMMKQLIQQAEQKEITCLRLEVREANRSAIALYKANGFRVNGKREKYYAETGENALLMERRTAEEKAKE